VTRTLCSFPGRAGDLLWCCACLREISATVGEPVDLQVCGEFDSLSPLLEQQPYIGTVYASEAWTMDQGWAGAQAARPPNARLQYDRIWDLGYRRWPELPLPQEIWQTSLVEREWVSPLDLTRPWLRVDRPRQHARIAVGWTECWFELKLGLHVVLQDHFGTAARLLQLCPPGSRWETEVSSAISVHPCGLLEAARIIRAADVFLGDCSALHVLAVGLGVPVILCEPMEARWDRIFYPLGKTGPQVTLVHGTDDRPTFDARHVCDALDAALAKVTA
jgi:hypothetical protein